MFGYLKLLSITSFFIVISFSIWVPNLNSLNLPNYTTIGESGIIDYAFWVGLKLGLIAREKNFYSVRLPLINIGETAFSNSVFLQLNYANSFIKGLHASGITVICSIVSKNDYLIKNMDYDFLQGKYTQIDLKARESQYKRIEIDVSKHLNSTINYYLKRIYLRSIRKLKLTNLPYKNVKVIGKYHCEWSSENAQKTLSISSTPVMCNTLFIIGNKKVDISKYENVFRIFQFNDEMKAIIKNIVLGNLADKLNF